jgi:TolA-binding protein
MFGNKIVARISASRNNKFDLKKAPVGHVLMGAFLCFLPACVMTRNEGELLHSQMRDVESEIAKLQRVRHEMEVLLSDRVKDLIDRVAKLESQQAVMRNSLYEGTAKSGQMNNEIERLRGQLEEAEHRYRNLQQDQLSLAQHQQALKQAQKKTLIPPLKKDHFETAKKYYLGGKFEEAIFLFDEFNKLYENDKDLSCQSYFHLGEIYGKLAESELSKEQASLLYKKSMVSYQKIIDINANSALGEEALYKMGLVLKAIGNKDAASAAFNELISQHKNGKRVALAKKELVGLKAKP